MSTQNNLPPDTNQELYEKSKKVASGIHKLIWAHTCFYIYNHIDEDLRDYNVYLNDYGKFTVKLDDGSTYSLIQPCPWLIYDLYIAHEKVNTGDNTDATLVAKAKAYEKFESFFEHMIRYRDIVLCG